MTRKTVLKVLDTTDAKQLEKWESFNLKHGYVWHSVNWIEIVQTTYGFKPLYLFIEKENEIVSILPTFHVKGLWGLKNELVSLPHVEAAGILNSVYLDKYLSFIGSRKNFKLFKLYQFEKKLDSFPANSVNSVFFLEIPHDRDELIRLFRKKGRCSFNKIKNPGVEIISHISRKNIVIFLNLLKMRMKEFGTPWHKEIFYWKLFDVFKENLFLLIAKKNGIPVGASVAVRYGDTCYSLYHVIPRKFQKHGISLTLYYYLMEKARNWGIKRFCFGRSRKGTGPYRFKKGFGAKEYPVYIYLFKKEKDALIPETVEFVSEKYEWATIFIRNLPMFLLNFLSGNLRKWVY